MTNPIEVVLSDEEINLLLISLRIKTWTPQLIEDAQRALAAFLAKRVPDAMLQTEMSLNYKPFEYEINGFNACRERVLKKE